MTVAYQNTDKATDHILDFIAGGVPTNEYGESAGNYNAVFGHIDADDPLNEKSFAEIYEMQTELLAENGISTATGRYQGLKSTIQEYQKRKGISSTTMFTQPRQDDFGFTKMCDRGYYFWWNNQISDDEFMSRLSCEWASLPDPYNGGKSHYDGDAAGNHASCSVVAFQAALTTAREYIDAPDNEVATPIPPAELEPPLRELILIKDADKGIKNIQGVLVRTGDLPSIKEIDGNWGPVSEAALNKLVLRSKLTP